MAEVISPYMRALFELAVEDDNLDALYQETAELLKVFQAEHRLADILNSPRIHPENKEALLNKIFAGHNKNLIGLMIVMIKKSRSMYIEAALKGFIHLTKEHKGIAGARVYSAVALTGGQLADLESMLSLCLNSRVEIEASVDPSLIGGLLIKAGGKIYDSTIKNQLRTLKKQLAKQVKETYG